MNKSHANIIMLYVDIIYLAEDKGAEVCHHKEYSISTPVAGGGGGVRRNPPCKLISTLKVDILFKNCDNQSPNWMKIFKNRTFRKYEWNAWKLLDCRILLLIPQGFWVPWAAPRLSATRCATRIASRRTPLWKFLTSGLISISILLLQF